MKDVCPLALIAVGMAVLLTDSGPMPASAEAAGVRPCVESSARVEAAGPRVRVLSRGDRRFFLCHLDTGRITLLRPPMPNGDSDFGSLGRPFRVSGDLVAYVESRCGFRAQCDFRIIVRDARDGRVLRRLAALDEPDTGPLDADAPGRNVTDLVLTSRADAAWIVELRRGYDLTAQVRVARRGDRPALLDEDPGIGRTSLGSRGCHLTWSRGTARLC